MSDQTIKFSISGLRGIWGNGLDENIARTYIEGFAILLQERGAKKVIIARDSRKSGPIISDIAKDVLSKAGFDVTDIGISPTPTIIFLIRKLAYDGGIMISASHNPPEYNGIKFLTERAMYANQSEVERIKNSLGQKPEIKEIGKISEDSPLGSMHVEHVVENVESSLIKSKKFKVVIDTINGAGYKLGPELLENLGCSVEILNGTPDGNFAHMPEPLPENLKTLGEKVREIGADIGFAQDPDADRLVIADETGEVVFEEYMLSLCIKSILEKNPGDIVTNLSTSNTNKDLAETVGHINYRSKVGEGNVVEEIVAHNAVIGGEGSGGVIYPKINLCRDSLTGMALILEYMARTGKKVSELIAELPKYEFVKTKMPFTGSVADIIEKVSNEFSDGVVDRQDGIRVDFPDSSWVQLRASNTEPIIRIWSEARTKDRAEELVNKVKRFI